MRITIAILALALGGCATGRTTIEFGAGKNKNWFGNSTGQDWVDQGGVAFYGGVRHEREISDRLIAVCHAMHLSQWNVGPPWNDDVESSVEHVGCAVGFEL